ncbi:MAG: choice-of-anchor J domain-containing protein [Bacteroidales bacterium]|nr:choice-of-anchor J domain-containing protein [Bacteroidales bacterium]
MKKLFIALTGVLALISLVSCQKENLEKEELPNKEGVTVKIVSGAGTKTYAVDGEIPTIYWSEGDYVAFFEVVDGTYHEAVYSNDAVISGRKASFSATLTSEDPAGSSYKYGAVYPGTNIGNYGDQDDDGEDDWFVLLPKEQNLIKGNMALNSDILISEQLDNGSARIENNTESLFTFHRLGTVVRLQLKGITPGELIRTITIHAPTNVAGYVKYEIATGQPASNYYMGYGDITLNLGDVTATGDDVIWFRVFSPENWNSFGIEVVTSHARYLRDGSDASHGVIDASGKPIKFINEGLTKFAVNLADYRVENAVKSVPYVENFDTDNSSEWAFIDSDGDSYGWNWNTGSSHTISGSGILQSASYINNEGPLTPDNWAFTPAIQLTEGNVLSFWVAGQDASWAEEHYAVYITEENPAAGLPGSSTLLHEETIGSGLYSPAQTRDVDGRTYYRFFVNIPAAFNNKVAYIGFRHYDCTDMFILNLDDVMVTEGNPDLEPEPEPEPDPTWLENFDATLTGWTFIDADNDGFEWQIGSSDNDNLSVHSGTGLLYSQSYDFDSGALTPDNWAFTPGITLTSGNYLSFWIAAQDSDYPEEHYAVYITDQAPNASNLTSCVKLHEETIDGADAATPVETSGKYRRFIIAIPSQFANKTVYIGFRHFNCTDMFYLNLDDVAIYDKNPKGVSSGTILSAAPVKSASSKPKGIYSADRKYVKSKSLTRK